MTAVNPPARSDVRDKGSASGAAELQLPARYEDIGLVGSGGFGEVRRVRDTRLDRVLVMKLLHPAASATPVLRQRFFSEIRITAQLQHPGIVPVYDNGELADGRLWYVMKEVRGTTFETLFKRVGSASDASAEERTMPTLGVEAAAEQEAAVPVPGWTFRRLLDAFARAVQTVAYAHGRGVVHRDLKPANLMAGELGEVLVLDWGLARRIGSGESEVIEPDIAASDASVSADLVQGGHALQSGRRLKAEEPALTQHGEVLGTPAYMPPEQARGATALHGPASDVYALGAMLYHLLSGRRPYYGDGKQVLAQILVGPPPLLDTLAEAGSPLPHELVEACQAAMQREIANRCSAEALAYNVLAWLDGARRREQALAVVSAAQQLEPEIDRLRAEARHKRTEATAKLDGVRPFDPAKLKQPGWTLQDEAKRLEVRSALREAEWLQRLQGALTVDPDLPEAHAALAAHHAGVLLEAERNHQEVDAARAEAALRVHDRGQYAALLRGEGALSLSTEPAGAQVQLERYTPSGRRLVTQDAGVLGVTPLRQVSLERGSYRLRIRAPGRHEVLYPVHIERGQHFDGIPPGAVAPHAIELPRQGELGPDECYVPAGWCWVGGDPEAPDSLPSRRLWIDGFVIGRYAVTAEQYLAFLNALVTNGKEQQALAACPHNKLSAERNAAARPLFSRNEDGTFVLPPDWTATLPVMLVSWHAARSYAAWLAHETTKPWRLPNELEREKAARGADGRLFSWGNHAEATYACTLESHRAEPRRAVVDAYPTDTSPYDVRGLCGNVRDWCLNSWKLQGPAVDNGRLQLDAALPADPEYRAIRGGAWGSAIRNGRAAGRFGGRPEMWTLAVGVRVARSLSATRQVCEAERICISF